MIEGACVTVGAGLKVAADGAGEIVAVAVGAILVEPAADGAGVTVGARLLEIAADGEGVTAGGPVTDGEVVGVMVVVAANGDDDDVYSLLEGAASTRFIASSVGAGDSVGAGVVPAAVGTGVVPAAVGASVVLAVVGDAVVVGVKVIVGASVVAAAVGASVIVGASVGADVVGNGVVVGAGLAVGLGAVGDAVLSTTGALVGECVCWFKVGDTVGVTSAESKIGLKLFSYRFGLFLSYPSGKTGRKDSSKRFSFSLS